MLIVTFVFIIPGAENYSTHSEQWKSRTHQSCSVHTVIIEMCIMSYECIVTWMWPS